MRTSLIALGLTLAACGPAERAPPAPAGRAPAGAARRGPDLLALRTPRAGGTARVFGFPQLDSLIWSSATPAPALERILGFDDAAGVVLAEAPKGVTVRIDFRLGSITRDDAPRLSDLTTADGSAAFGIAADGAIVRVTPSGNWRFKPPAPAREILPQPDGQLLVLASRSGGARGAVVWAVRPPDATITDSASLPTVYRAVRTPVGDRVYFVAKDSLLVLRTKGLEPAPAVPLARPAHAVVTTPSGDRVYVAPDSMPQVLVIDRYTGRLAATIAIPAPALALRMDPLGRILLARTGDDSVLVLAVATDRLVGAVRSAWRADLPAVTPNGWLALAAGNDVLLVTPDSLREMRTVAGGAKDLWGFFAWNGFRPRAAGLDEPVTFPEDTMIPRDSANQLADLPRGMDSVGAPDSTHRESAPPPADRDSAARAPTFTVQFAALRTDSAARAAMRAVRVAGSAPRVVPSTHDGVTVYRVVIGPFRTRDDAERVARTAGMSFWVYEGEP